MKWIKYQIVQSIIGEETVLVNKKVGYSDENIAIAEKEAYDGYEIVEDTESFDKEPLAINVGGTGANTADAARTNLGIGCKIITSLATLGLSGAVTTAQVFAAMPANSVLYLENNVNNTDHLSDAPTSFCGIELVRTSGNYGFGKAVKVNSTAFEYYDCAYYKASNNFSGWNRMMPNVMTAYESGPTLPAAGNKGRMYFKQVTE